MTLWERLSEFFASLFGFGPSETVGRGTAETVAADLSPFPAGDNTPEANATYGDLLQYLTFNLLSPDVSGNPGYPSSAGGSNSQPTTANVADRVAAFLASLGGSSTPAPLPNVETYPFPFQPGGGITNPLRDTPNTDVGGGKFTPYTAPPPINATSTDFNATFGGNVVIDQFLPGNDAPPSVNTVNQNTGGVVPVLNSAPVKPTIGAAGGANGGGRFAVQ